MMLLMILCDVVVTRPVTIKDLCRSLIAVKPRPLARLMLLRPVELHRIGAYYCTTIDDDDDEIAYFTVRWKTRASFIYRTKNIR